MTERWENYNGKVAGLNFCIVNVPSLFAKRGNSIGTCIETARLYISSFIPRIDQQDHLREVCGKSKRKFKMAFAMKGGGLEGVASATYLFWKIFFVKNHLESFPDCENVFCT